jgi:hypothetical protein
MHDPIRRVGASNLLIWLLILLIAIVFWTILFSIAFILLILGDVITRRLSSS